MYWTHGTVRLWHIVIIVQKGNKKKKKKRNHIVKRFKRNDNATKRQWCIVCVHVVYVSFIVMSKYVLRNIYVFTSFLNVKAQAAVVRGFSVKLIM